MVDGHANGSRRRGGLTDAEGRLTHLPALDGLRGLAVAGVVLFHAGFEWMVGGYLGVSTFFTLSGFLITSLLVAEAGRTGTVSLRRFWTRRFRRLLPAALLTLAVVTVAFAPLVATPAQRADLPGDVLASLADVVNWRFVLQGSSYGDLFAAPSPVLHFWSLAIEEQFYVLFPLVLVGLWALARGRARAVGAALAVAVVALALLPWALDLSVDRVYFGTDTRAPELLLGSLLAIAMSEHRWRRRLVLNPTWRGVASVAGAVALAVQLWWWWSLPQSTSWLYRGGFALYAVLTCAVLAAATLPRGPFVAALSVAPLRWLGTRSYGIYLFHWPLFLTVRQVWPELSRVASTGVVVAVSLVLAELSVRLLEQPVRAGAWPAPGRALRVAGASMAAVALLAFVPWPGGDEPRTTDFAAAERAFDRMGRTADGTGGAAPVPTTVPPATTPVPAGGPTPATAVPVPPPVGPPAGVAFFGDSTALAVGMGYHTWVRQQGLPTRVVGDAELGCAISRFDRRREDLVTELNPTCARWPERFGGVMDAERPDVAVLVTAAWEIPDVQLPGSDEWQAVGDPEVDEFVRAELRTAVDLLSRDGALVLLMTWPEYGTWADDGRPDAVRRQMDPARMQRFHQLLREVAAERPGQARVLEFAGWFGDRSQDRSLREDGTHFLMPDFARLAQEWFGAEVQRLWQDWSAGRPSVGG